MISLLFRIDIARGYLAIAFPLGLVGLMLGRWSMRKVVTHKRRQGDCHTSVLVVGNRESVLTMTRNFERDSASGYRVVGVCVRVTDTARKSTLSSTGARSRCSATSTPWWTRCVRVAPTPS